MRNDWVEFQAKQEVRANQGVGRAWEKKVVRFDSRRVQGA
jgi:hypothetical protein